jgi:nucleotide-binding universal stress UspA family protein
MVRVLGERWSVPDEILAVAEEVDAELICMATHGESALRHFVAGSVALEVLSKTRRPVVLVRAA